MSENISISNNFSTLENVSIQNETTGKPKQITSFSMNHKKKVDDFFIAFDSVWSSDNVSSHALVFKKLVFIRKDKSFSLMISKSLFSGKGRISRVFKAI
jgi:hypothetical protein